MSRELLNGEVGKYKYQLWNKEITEEKLMQDLRDVFFMEPLVAEDVFVDVVRQYDKNFAPIPEGPERQKRTDIMKKAQDGVLKQAMHERSTDLSGFTFPEGKEFDRHHYILLRGGTAEEKQQMI